MICQQNASILHITNRSSHKIALHRMRYPSSKPILQLAEMTWALYTQETSKLNIKCLQKYLMVPIFLKKIWWNADLPVSLLPGNWTVHWQKWSGPHCWKGISCSSLEGQISVAQPHRHGSSRVKTGLPWIPVLEYTDQECSKETKTKVFILPSEQEPANWDSTLQAIFRHFDTENKNLTDRKQCQKYFTFEKKHFLLYNALISISFSLGC